MSKYTMQIRFACENLIGRVHQDDYSQTDQTISQARPLIFNFNYNLFGDGKIQNLPLTKTMFEEYFIRHFYFREIGYETYELWHFKLRTWLLTHTQFYNDYINTLFMQMDLENEVLYPRVTHTKRDYSLKQDANNTQDLSRNMDESHEKIDNTSETTHAELQRSSNDSLTNTHNDTTTDVFSENSRVNNLDTPQSEINAMPSDISPGYLTNYQTSTHGSNDAVNNTGGYVNTDVFSQDDVSNGTRDSETTEQYNGDQDVTQHETDVIDDTKVFDELVSYYGYGQLQNRTDVITKYRESLFNAFEFIFDDMDGLFMQVF